MTNPEIPEIDLSTRMLNFAVLRILVASIAVQTLCVSAAVVGSLLAPAIARAQVPWTVSLTPSMNPLAIGGCTPVRLALADPTTRDWPRNPVGNYLSIADFDMSVTSPDPMGVAGEYNGPSIWSACACQGATVGSSATITASYPAKMLAQKARVPGVAFQATASFTIAKPRGAGDVAPCQALKSQTLVTGTSAATARAMSTATLAQPSTASSQPVGATPLPGTPIVPMATLAPPVLAPVTVVARVEWPLPFQGSINLSPGYCQVVYGSYTDSNILITDAVIVTGQVGSQGEQLKWTAVVDNGSVTFNVCNSQKQSLGASGALGLNGRKLNILVLR